ncbi:MAG: hypothetical protein KGZ85_08850 [Ignavibacterium sp.]|nr:hypothetical protein [Ignavibacterium sp.]
MKKIILTIDYELFLGKVTGTVEDCMIKPTEKLASILNENGSKMTVFWDVLHYYRLLEIEENFNEIKQDRILIEKQILDLAAAGHDIQLHLHPHWLDALYIEGKWNFTYKRFKLHNLSDKLIKEDINTITGCVAASKNLIENLIKQVKPDYRVTTFRAGGYLIEPFLQIREALIVNDIFIDSSICPGLTNDNEIFSFNFIGYPDNNSYKFDVSPKMAADNGKFLELPITTVRIPAYKNLIFTVIKKIKYPHLEKGRKGIGSGYSTNNNNNKYFVKRLRKVTRDKNNQFTTDSNFKEKFDYIFNKVPQKSTMILHPKLLNNHTCAILNDYISNLKVNFISIKDYLEKK